MSLVIAKGKFPTFHFVEHFLHTWVDRVVASLRLLLDFGYLVLQATEDEHGVISTLLSNFNVRTVHRANNETTIHHKFHIRSARRLSPAVEMCSEMSEAGMTNS